jgi:hypothetical protein
LPLGRATSVIVQFDVFLPTFSFNGKPQASALRSHSLDHARLWRPFGYGVAALRVFANESKPLSTRARDVDRLDDSVLLDQVDFRSFGCVQRRYAQRLQFSMNAYPMGRKQFSLSVNSGQVRWSRHAKP